MHFAVELCIAMLPVEKNKRYRKQLMVLLKKCIHLQALEAFCDYCEYCRSIGDENLQSLSHFPALQHLMLTHSPGIDTMNNTCKSLEYFICFSDRKLFLTSVHCQHLQQLYIGSEKSDIVNSLMETVISTW